jgi:hypothetical protein
MFENTGEANTSSRSPEISLLVIAFLLLSVSLLDAGTTGKQTRHADPSIHCQIEADGKCHCGPRKGTGRNRPCIPDQRTSPRQPPAEPQGCPVGDAAELSGGEFPPYITQQWQPDPPGGQVRRRGELLREATEAQRLQQQAELQSYSNRIVSYLHGKFKYPQGIHPYKRPYTVEVIEGTQIVRRRVVYPYLVRTGLKVTIERCDGDTYRVKNIERDRTMTAAFMLDTSRQNPWVPVVFNGSEFFENNAVQAAGSLNTDPRGRQLLRFPSSYSGMIVNISVVLKNWDSHDLPASSQQY